MQASFSRSFAHARCVARTLAQALSASRAFLAAKPSGYLVSIVTFASRALQLTPFSTSSGDAELALRSMTIDDKTGTTIYDAVALSSAQLRSEGSPGRVIILITDGQDTTSTTTARRAIDAARRAHVTVYPIAIKDATYTPRPLRALADTSGGTMFVAAPGESLAPAYGLISARLQRTWPIRSTRHRGCRRARTRPCHRSAQNGQEQARRRA
jgi:hypothetical protein